MVKKAIKTKNSKRLNEECHKLENSILRRKTTLIVNEISNRNYKRKPQKELLNATKQETKTIMIARYGMLECGKDFKGSLKKICEQCNKSDD